MPLPWTAADEPALADFSRPAPADDGTGENHVPLCAAGQFGTGASFGFSPATRAEGVTPAADPHLPQPLWFKDYAVDVEQADPDSMLALYRAALAIRQESLTATRDTTAEQVDMGDDVVAYTRAAVGGRVFTSITNFGNAPVALPDGSVVRGRPARSTPKASSPPTLLRGLSSRSLGISERPPFRMNRSGGLLVCANQRKSLNLGAGDLAGEGVGLVGILDAIPCSRRTWRAASDRRSRCARWSTSPAAP